MPDWPVHERLGEEFTAMGFYLSGHPLDAYGPALKRLGATTYASLMEDRRRAGFKAKLAGTLIKKSERRGRNDQMYAFVSFSDPTGMFEVMLFPEVLAASRPLLEAGKSLLITASADWDGDELKLRAASIIDLDQAAAQAGEGMVVRLDSTPRRLARYRGATDRSRERAGQLRGAGRAGRGSGDRAVQAPRRDRDPAQQYRRHPRGACRSKRSDRVPSPNRNFA